MTSKVEDIIRVPSINEVALVEDQESHALSPQSSEKAAEPVPVPKHSIRFYLAFCTLSVITLAAALDATSLGVALPIISQDIHGTAIEAFWSGTSFLLTSTVFQPVFAMFSHISGRKPLVLIALTFFAVGAIVCATAGNFTVMLVGRSIQGIGGGGIIALAEIIVTDLVSLRQRGKYFGFLSMMWAVGSTTGPILGGSFAQNGAFWIQTYFSDVLLTCLSFMALDILDQPAPYWYWVCDDHPVSLAWL